MKYFNDLLYKVKSIGLLNVCLGVVERFRNHILYMFFHFDRWHIGATYHLRPYKSQIVSIANNFSPNSVVEVGCGLGDIISRVKSCDNIGVDIELNVINAANFMYGKQCAFICSDLSKVSNYLNKKILGKKNLMIAVNWTHNISFLEISSSISMMSKNLNINYILVDIIDKDVDGYKYNHSISDYNSLGELIHIYRSKDLIRQFLLIELK